MLKPVELHEFLSADNPWTARLTGRQPYARERDPDLVRREYDVELYGARLATWREDPESLRRRVLSGGEGQMRVSLGGRIYETSAPVWQGIRRQLIQAALARYGAADPLCELGAGFGQNLIWLGGDSYGGEISPNARELAGLLGLDVHPFDFRDAASYGFIRPATSLLTCHAVEQIPDAGPMIEALRRIRGRIRVVVHFEPLYGRERADLLGILRDRYTELCDYNRNLKALVDEADDIEVLGCEPDRFGNNPLNPTGILAWRFR